MEWCLSINDMLKDEITKLNHTLLPPGLNVDVRTSRIIQHSLGRVIDDLGEQSRVAQGLNKVITATDKMYKSPSQTLYLLKDPNGYGGKGKVIGMLKVGHKHLYLTEEDTGRVVEVEPLCVLDFFVLPELQRLGHGRRLFEYMLQDTNTKADELAIDGPSPKMEKFLIKNFGIERLLRQSNNFAVAPNFFKNNSSIPSGGGGVRVAAQEATPMRGRFAAPKPHSTISSIIHGHGNVFYKEGTSSETEGERPPEAAEGPVEPQREPQPHHGNGEVELEWDEAVFAERPTTLPLEEEAAAAPADPEHDPPGEGEAATPASRPDPQLTERGYFDIKFYHNKLW